MFQEDFKPVVFDTEEANTKLTITNMSISEIENDDAFGHDTHDLRREEMKYSRLKMEG